MYTGEKIRLLRLIKGLKQQNVAERLGITQQAYSKLEKKDNITEETLNRIIQSMNCSWKDLEMIEKISLQN